MANVLPSQKHATELKLADEHYASVAKQPRGKRDRKPGMLPKSLAVLLALLGTMLLLDSILEAGPNDP